jgi:hypothetical protein
MLNLIRSDLGLLVGGVLGAWLFIAHVLYAVFA